MSLEIFQAIPVVDSSNLRPILSTLSDQALGDQIETNLGLTSADSLFSFLNTNVRGFDAGRLVVVNSLSVDAMQRRVEADLGEEVGSRWFLAAGFVLRLSEQKSQGCYGGWRKGFALSVFGQ